MPQLRYVGPHDEVHVPAVGVTAKRGGDPVDIHDSDVAASLLEQETWERVKTTKSAGSTGKEE